MKGFYIWIKNGYEIFVETAAHNKTENLAREILQKANLPIDDGSIKEIIRRMRRAECEIKNCSHGEYYDIHGDGFGGYGYFLDGRDGKTEIIKI